MTHLSLFSIFDWGYENILPPHKYETIKNFIVIN